MGRACRNSLSGVATSEGTTATEVTSILLRAKEADRTTLGLRVLHERPYRREDFSDGSIMARESLLEVAFEIIYATGQFLCAVGRSAHLDKRADNVDRDLDCAR